MGLYCSIQAIQLKSAVRLLNHEREKREILHRKKNNKQKITSRHFLCYGQGFKYTLDQAFSFQTKTYSEQA